MNRGDAQRIREHARSGWADSACPGLNARSHRWTRFVRELVAVATALVATVGCYTSHTRTPYREVRFERVFGSTAGDSPLSYNRSEVRFTNHTAGEGATPMYELRELELPSCGDNGQKENLVKAKYYRTVKPGARPLLIVMPIWGTYTYPPRKIASSMQRLSGGDIHVLHIQGDEYIADWTGLAAAEDETAFFDLWRQAAERLRVTMIDVRRLIDWAENRPEINAERIALIGFSFSAVAAATIATQEPRLSATVTVMGGGHLNSIIATCDGKRATSIQEKTRQSFGWSPDVLEAQLAPIVDHLNPTTYPNRVDPSRVLVIDAGRDKCVPRASRDDVWEALGRPERITLDYDHAPAFFAMSPLGLNWLRKQIWQFLEPRLLGP